MQNMLIYDSVKILTKTNKVHYIPNFEKTGIIERQYKKKYGVSFTDRRNPNSHYGLFWYDKDDLEITYKQEDLEMTGYKYVAIVNMFNDVNRKDYAFALYETEKDLLVNQETMELYINEPLVVTNSTSKNNRTLAIVKEIKPVEEYKGCKITAQIVGVVNMYGYLDRKAAEEKELELKRKKNELITQIQARVDKLNNLAYFERIANQFADIDPDLAGLVDELKGLSGINATLNTSLTDTNTAA